MKPAEPANATREPGTVIKEKKSIKYAIGEACFRFRAISVVPVVLLVFFLFDPVDLGACNPIMSVLGVATALVGAVTRIIAVGHAKPFTSGRENYLKAENLNTTGLYSIVRNPLYVGNFLVYNGVLLAYSSPAALALFNAFFIPNYYFIILSEERYLENQFGEAYSEYRGRVPKVIPKFSLYKKDELSFDPARAAFKEKNTTLYWVFFCAVALLVKQYRLNDGAITHFWWHAAPVLILFALNVILTLVAKSKPA